MASKIEWTEETWNPTVGCSRVSPGCGGPEGGLCYAIRQAARFQHSSAYEGTVVTGRDGLDWTGVVRCLPERLDIPLRRRKPTMFFVDSMSDLFHPEVPDYFICQVFVTMWLAQRHTFQILTKRPQRMEAFVADLWKGLGPNAPEWPAETPRPHPFFPYPNVWLGTSIESDRYCFRADHLRAAPAAVRFLSLEPLLGPLPSLNLTGMDWVIVGGQSGPGSSPMHPSWVRQIRARCVDARIAFFFKQWGDWEPYGAGDRMRRVGKGKAGRVLDGRTWDELPPAAR